MQGRPDKLETLLPRVFPPDGSWWFTASLLSLFIPSDIVFPSPRPEAQAPHTLKLILARLLASALKHASLQRPGLYHRAAWCSLPAIASKVCAP